jgi:hypothetical protein
MATNGTDHWRHSSRVCEPPPALGELHIRAQREVCHAQQGNRGAVALGGGRASAGPHMRACPLSAIAHAGHVSASRVLRLAVLRRVVVPAVQRLQLALRGTYAL